MSPEVIDLAFTEPSEIIGSTSDVEEPPLAKQRCRRVVLPSDDPFPPEVWFGVLQWTSVDDDDDYTFYALIYAVAALWRDFHAATDFACRLEWARCVGNPFTGRSICDPTVRFGWWCEKYGERTANAVPRNRIHGDGSRSLKRREWPVPSDAVGTLSATRVSLYICHTCSRDHDNELLYISPVGADTLEDVNDLLGDMFHFYEQGRFVHYHFGVITPAMLGGPGVIGTADSGDPLWVAGVALTSSMKDDMRDHIALFKAQYPGRVHFTLYRDEWASARYVTSEAFLQHLGV